MKQILEAMQTVTPQLQSLESQMMECDFNKRNIGELLGENPQLAFSKLIEFKAALDRMRGLTWVYMEAAASLGKLPAQRIPPALKQFLQQQATKTQAAHNGKKH